jgi:nitrogen fixation NifU-like protein
MDELRDLYQQVILDHNKNPRNYHKLENANRIAEGNNPLCGDQFTIYLLLEDDVIRDISFEGSGCAISKASASIMSSTLKGKSKEDAQNIFEQFHKIVTGENKEPDTIMKMGKLAAFAGVAEFPVRVKCAILAWHTMISALNDEDKVVSME